MEIKNLWTMHINEHITAAINEYGSHFTKSKFDSLAAIQAKHALLTGGSGPSKVDDKMSELESVNAIITLKPIQSEVQLDVEPVRDEATTPSPYHGTQEAPVADWSSLEDFSINLSQNTSQVPAENEVNAQISPD